MAGVINAKDFLMYHIMFDSGQKLLEHYLKKRLEKVME